MLRYTLGVIKLRIIALRINQATDMTTEGTEFTETGRR